MKELYMRNCNLKEISPLAFSGLENFLEVLDLSGNHISSLSDEIFQALGLLKTLSLRENTLLKLNAIQSINGAQFSLYHLDLSGQNAPVSLQELKRFK